MRDFNSWLSGFRASIADYSYYVDFDKVYANVDAIKVELNILNTLIGSKNIKEEFIGLLKRFPETLKVIPILLAKRESEIYCQDENGGYLYQFDFGKYLKCTPLSRQFFFNFKLDFGGVIEAQSTPSLPSLGYPLSVDI